MDSNGEWFLCFTYFEKALHFFLYLKEKEVLVTIGQKLFSQLISRIRNYYKETFFTS
ncbi:hypothetical protein HYD90_02320 [Mycoplasmopsis bovis]|nr:hypothetical protein HYD90_02320 [Mycoplasmopsis bovis]